MTLWSGCDSYQLTGTVRISVRGRMIGPLRVLSSETCLTHSGIFVPHFYDVPNTCDQVRMSQYAFKLPQTASNHFALCYTNSAAIIVALGTFSILTRVFATHDKSIKCRMRMLYSISNSIRCFFNIYMTCRNIKTGIVGHTMMLGSFSSIVHYSLRDIGVFSSPFTLPRVFPCSISFLVLPLQNLCI